MKKIIVALGLLLAMAYSAVACDICGCAAGSNGMGILPRFKKNFIGIRSSYSSFNSTHPTLFASSEKQTSQEYFSTTTLWGRYVPHQRVQLFAQLPYTYFLRNEDGQSTTTKGIGDITLLANYVVFNTTDSSSKIKHSLQVGGGIKLPTGAYNKQANGNLLNINMQQGTGSYDVPLNLIHTLRIQSFGINTELNYTLTTTNPNLYKQGNKFLGAISLFYWKNRGNLTFLPQTGIRLEHYDEDIKEDNAVEYTGGKTLQFTLGTDVYFYKWAVGAHLKQPISSTMGQGYIQPRLALNFNVMYLL